MFEWFRQSRLGPDHLVLDVGSRDANQAVELAQHFGCGFVVDQMLGKLCAWEYLLRKR